MPDTEEGTKREMRRLKHELEGNSGQYEKDKLESMQNSLDFLQDFYTEEGKLKDSGPENTAHNSGHETKKRTK